jgi:hypothetical protein
MLSEGRNGNTTLLLNLYFGHGYGVPAPPDGNATMEE